MIYNGDALKILRSLPAESIHLIITSPPYNLGKRYDIYEDNLEYDEYLATLTRIFIHAHETLVDGGRICLNIAPTGLKYFKPQHHDLITRLRQSGYRFCGEIIWNKNNETTGTSYGSWQSPSCPYVFPCWEYVYILQKGGRKLKRDDKKPDVGKEFQKLIQPAMWNISPAKAKKGNPVPFPEELVRRLIKLYSYPGNTVCDPFCGSGTTGAVAKRLQREFVGIDLSLEYCREAELRIANVTDGNEDKLIPEEEKK